MPQTSSIRRVLLHRVLLLEAISVLLIASPFFASTASAYERGSVNNEGEVPFFWSQRTIHYAINPAAINEVKLEDVVGAVQRAFFSWASPSCTDLYFIYDGQTSTQQTNLTLPLNAEPDGQNTVIWRDRWPPPGAEQGAVTSDLAARTTLTFVAASGEIIDADIDLNGQDFYWSATDVSGQVATDIQSVMTREVGHLLGLAESGKSGAVMYGGPIVEGDISRRQLSQDDVDGICKVYPFGEETPDQPETPPAVVGAGGGCCSTAGQGEQASSSLLLTLLLIGAFSLRRRASILKLTRLLGTVRRG